MISSNPFCTRFVRPGAIEYLFTSGYQEPLVSICNEIKTVRRGLIVGPHGSGKSTLIHSLTPILEQTYRNVVAFQLCDSKLPNPIDSLRHARQRRQALSQRLSQLDNRDLLIIDGIEQLGAIDRMRLLRRGPSRSPSVLATSHRPLFGFRLLFETTLERRRINELTEQLVQNSPSQLIGLVRDKLANQDWEHTTNLREFWFECYDHVQTYQQQNLAS